MERNFPGKQIVERKTFFWKHFFDFKIIVKFRVFFHFNKINQKFSLFLWWWIFLIFFLDYDSGWCVVHVCFFIYLLHQIIINIVTEPEKYIFFLFCLTPDIFALFFFFLKSSIHSYKHLRIKLPKVIKKVEKIHWIFKKLQHFLDTTKKMDC